MLQPTASCWWSDSANQYAGLDLVLGKWQFLHRSRCDCRFIYQRPGVYQSVGEQTGARYPTHTVTGDITSARTWLEDPEDQPD